MIGPVDDPIMRLFQHPLFRALFPSDPNPPRRPGFSGGFFDGQQGGGRGFQADRNPLDALAGLLLSAFGPDGPPPGVLPGTGPYSGPDFKMTPWDIQNYVPRSPGGRVPNPGARPPFPFPGLTPGGGAAVPYMPGNPAMGPGGPMRLY